MKNKAPMPSITAKYATKTNTSQFKATISLSLELPLYSITLPSLLQVYLHCFFIFYAFFLHIFVFSDLLAIIAIKKCMDTAQAEAFYENIDPGILPPRSTSRVGNDTMKTENSKDTHDEA